jgi:hypothetical protein
MPVGAVLFLLSAGQQLSLHTSVSQVVSAGDLPVTVQVEGEAVTPDKMSRVLIQVQ